MTKINELITVHSGYAKYVNLVQTYNDPTQNRERMAHYMPIKSHREAFTRLARALYPLDNRVYLLTGSYGTGKSHLCLMLANYLALKPSEPEPVQFFANWAQRDPEGAEKLRNLRGEGRYLVALADYGQGDDFDSLILRAIGTAIEREELEETWLDTHYGEAVRQLDRWQARVQSGGPTGVLGDFRDELTRRYPGRTEDALREDLTHFNSEALTIFREVYRAVVGHEFTYSKDNLIAILRDFLTNSKFRTRYKGLVIIADEFGYILDRGNLRIDVFTRFAELCQNGVEGSQLIFVGTGHKAFTDYAAGGLSMADFRVAAARVTEVPLESAELELIISAIVVPNKASPVWQTEIASQAGTFNRLALASSRIGIFKHLKGPEIRTRIVEDIYPMHPLATHCLIEMSTEVGSNARSVFSFFSGDVQSEPIPGSYRWYARNTDVRTADRLNLYTADQLVTYFQAELKHDNVEARERVRQHVRNYRASLAEVQRRAQAELTSTLDPLVERILNILLVYEISRIAPTFDNLAFGLTVDTPAEKSQLQNRLDALVKQKALYQLPAGLYEFRRSEATDFEALLQQQRTNPDNTPTDLAADVAGLVSLGRGGAWLDAKNHNQPYGEDKRVLRVFARPGDLEGQLRLKSLGQEVSFFEYLERQMAGETDWKERYEGVLVYVICETDEEITRARRAAEGNPSARIAVGVPRQPLPVREVVTNLRAAQALQKSTDIETISLQDRGRLQEIIGDEQRETGYAGDFIRARRRYLDAKELSWYGQGGLLLVAQPKNEYEPADELMGRLYTKRNIVPHAYLNQIHVARFGPGKDVPLGDAVASLLRTHRNVEIDHSAPASRGERRYLKDVLADTGALQQVGPAQGTVAQYRIEPMAEKFSQKLPALAGLLDVLRSLNQGETRSIRELLAVYADVPYGLGPAALSLFFAYAVRAFGDELRFQLQPGAIGYVTMNDPDLVLAIVNGDRPNAIVERQPISASGRALINGVYNQFAPQPGAAGQQHTISEAYNALCDWWGRRTELARVANVYEPGTTTRSLVDLLTNIAGANPYVLILEQLQTVYGFSSDTVIAQTNQTAILEGLTSDKTAIEQDAKGVKDALLRRLMAPFHPVGDFYGDYQTAMERWYHDLGDEQRDLYAKWHSNPSRAVVQRLRTVTNIEDTFFEQLPADAGFGLGRVDDWHRDRSDEYVQMFEAALERIAANRAKVPLPAWKVLGVCRKEDAGDRTQVFFRNGVQLEVRSPAPDIKVLVTDTGEDPRTALQRLTVEDEYKLPVKQTRVIKLVCQGGENTFGQVVTLSFINEDTKYEVAPISQQRLIGDREYKFVYPIDKEALRVLLGSIMRDVLKQGLVKPDEMRHMLTELADHLEGLY